MSTEPTESTSHYGDDGHGAGSIAAPAQGTGEGSSSPAGSPGSTSGRRRRRRRKNKGAGGAAAVNGQAQQPAGESSPQDGAASTAVAPPVQAPAQPQTNGHGQGKRKNGRKRSGGSQSNGGAPQPANANGGGQTRPRQNRQNGGSGWKSRNSDGPDGNREGARGGFGSEAFQEANGNGGGRRKNGGKFGRRGPSSFVGPMDHSYRTVNGNVADGPPSTMDYRNVNGNANGNVNGRNDYFDPEPVIVQREDAPTRIFCFIEDLFVVAKMQETARKLGVKVQFVKADKETLATLTNVDETNRPSLIVFDLNNAGAKPLTLIPKLKAKLKRGTSIIGFLQHIQGDLKLKAIEAGCDSVMPKAAFSQNLPNLLRRHGFAEEEEVVEA